MIGKNLASWCKLFWKYSERQVTWSPSCQRILGVCGTKAIRPRKSQIHGCKSISLQIFANGNPKVAVLLLLLRLWTPRPPPFWGVLIWLGFLLKHASFVVGNLAHVMQTCSIVQHRATSCNIVQHRATSCNIVQHRATSCNRSTSRYDCLALQFDRRCFARRHPSRPAKSRGKIGWKWRSYIFWHKPRKS